MYGKTDARFIDGAFRLLREEFRYFPALTTHQLLSSHFVERKIVLLADVLGAIVAKHREMVLQRKREKATWTEETTRYGSFLFFCNLVHYYADNAMLCLGL